MTNSNTAAASPATLSECYPYSAEDFMLLEQFAWLIENTHGVKNSFRLVVLWGWAKEMVDLQEEANLTGKSVEYFQRGEVLRTLYPHDSLGRGIDDTSSLIATMNVMEAA